MIHVFAGSELRTFSCRQESQEGCVEAIPPSSSDSSSFIASLEDSHQFPGGAVIGMEVWDPRGHSHSDITFQPTVLVDARSDEMEVEDMDVAVSESGWQLAGNREMWDRLDIIGQGSIVKPSSEKDLCTRRHKERLSYIQLNDISEDTKEELSVASETLKCPILILKHPHQMPSACGWVF
jgi:hypothetical protein